MAFVFHEALCIKIYLNIQECHNIRIYYSLETLIPANEFLMLLCVFYYYMKQSKYFITIF